MKVRDVFVFSLLAVFLLLPSVQAIEVLESQEDITLTLERGSTYEFPLMLQNVNEITTIESADDIDDWIGFWSENDQEYEIYPGQSYVLVIITVPSKADLGEYNGEIEYDGKKLSQINVKVTLELNDVMAYETLSDMDEEVGTLQDKVDILTDNIGELRSHVATLEYNVSEKIDEIYKYQKDLTMLEGENERLASDSEEMKSKLDGLESSNEELNDLTGALVGTQLPGMFIGGILLGVITMVTILNRREVKRKLKKKLGMHVSNSHHKKFNYSFKK